MKKTLIDANNTVRPGTTPYTYIVNTDKVTALEDGEPKYFLNAEGETVGVVVDGKYDITGAPEQANLCLVIASGNVNVSSSYTGLIISGKNINLSGNDVDILHDPNGVDAAFNAIAGGVQTDTLGSYLLRGVNTGEDTVASGGSDGWDLDYLVTYKNWTKN